MHRGRRSSPQSGRPRATSAAKVGPESTAWGQPDSISPPTSDIVLSDPVSIPLVQCNIGNGSRRCGWSCRITPRRNCAGTTSNTPSAPSIAAAISVVARILGSRVTSGKNMGFRCRSLISDTTSRSRAQSTASEPACRATIASAVPHAPPPMTARRLNCASRRRSRLDPGTWTPRRGAIERPARAQRCVQPIDQPEPQPLNAGPRDHRPVIGAQYRRGRHKAQPRLLCERRQSLPQKSV